MLITTGNEPLSLNPPKNHYAGLITFLAAISLWQLLDILAIYPTYILPSPSAVAKRFMEVSNSGMLIKHISVTLLEALLGFGLAFVVAGMLCYPIARFRLFADLLSPLLAATQAVPLVAIAPLLVIWFGFGLLPKVITCALIVFFPLLLNAVSGLKNIEKLLLEAAAVFGASGWQIFWLVELPLALPTALTGIKIGLSISLTGAVVGEFLSADAGLGYLLNLGRGQFDTALVFVALLTLMTIALILYGIFGSLEKYLLNKLS